MSFYQLEITCAPLNNLLAYVTHSDHAGRNLHNKLASMTALAAYAQLQTPDKTFIPLPDNGQLDKDWLAACLPKTWQIDYLPSEVFARKYPQFATLHERPPPPPPAAEIDARA